MSSKNVERQDLRRLAGYKVHGVGLIREIGRELKDLTASDRGNGVNGKDWSYRIRKPSVTATADVSGCSV